VAVDASGRAVVRSGSTWAAPVPVGANSSSGLDTVSCLTATFCVATGEHTTQVFTYGGDGWTATDSSTTVDVVLTRLSCGSTAFCVGVSGSFAYVGRVP
jgi:hypothetical protein